MNKILIVGFALWRIGTLLIHDRGPYAIIERFRDEIGIIDFNDLTPSQQSDIIGELQLMPHEMPPQKWSFNELGKLFTCMNCLSIWIAALYVLLFEKEDKVKKLFAYSGIMIALESKI